jgi:hypothetical protein
MEAVVATSIESAARGLWSELTRLRVSDVVSVGVREPEEEILVYVARAAPGHRNIPSSWEGYRVVVRRVGGIRPARVG